MWRLSVNTGVEDLYVMKENKRLRCGFTTGSCAAGAAYAAVLKLLRGSAPEAADLMTPKGIRLHLPIEEASGSGCICGVRKDAGDDPDVTDGAVIQASAELIMPEEISGRGIWRTRQAIDKEPGTGEEAVSFPGHSHVWMRRRDAAVLLDGGEGVGRVTKPGLSQRPGEAAINKVPRDMIFDAAFKACEECGFSGNVLVIISVPEGEKLAERTFNPRLGIVGGISILGTSGIVEPMSEESLISSIRLEMSMKIRQGGKNLLVVPGRYGENFVKGTLGIGGDDIIICSNYVGKTVDAAVEFGAEGILFAAHIGKFIKVAGGIMNTHSREADSRAELCAAYAMRAGISGGDALRILETETTDEAVDIMYEAGVLPEAMKLICAAIKAYLQHRCDGRIRTEAILYNTSRGLLGMTDGAGAMLEEKRSRIV